MPAMPYQNFTACSRKPNMIRFGMFPAGSDLSWIDCSGTITVTAAETPAGTIDGVNDTFTLAGAPALDAGGVAELWLSKNGILLAPGVGFTISGGTITFLAGYIPQAGNVIRATYFT